MNEKEFNTLLNESSDHDLKAIRIRIGEEITRRKSIDTINKWKSRIGKCYISEINQLKSYFKIENVSVNEYDVEVKYINFSISKSENNISLKFYSGTSASLYLYKLTEISEKEFKRVAKLFVQNIHSLS